MSILYLHNPSLQSYDATTHFESTVDDVLNMYSLITGKVRSEFPPSLRVLKQDLSLHHHHGVLFNGNNKLNGEDISRAYV